jgi:hypothetical protein
MSLNFFMQNLINTLQINTLQINTLQINTLQINTLQWGSFYALIAPGYAMVYSILTEGRAG